MPSFDKGAIVTHDAYGRGTVLATRHRGLEVQVSFGRFRLWMPEKDLRAAGPGLRLVSDQTTPPKSQTDAPADSPDDESSLGQLMGILYGKTDSPTEAQPSPPIQEPRFTPTLPGRAMHQASAIEAFRLGLVPTDHIDHWTVGRTWEIGRIRDFLRDWAEGAILIEGAYGAGKSHLLRYLGRDAVSQGYAVSEAGFDPSEATAAFPKKAFRRLAQGFRATVGGETLQFRAFLRAVARHPKWEDVLGNHPLLSFLLHRLAKGREDEETWDWIEARWNGRSPLPTLHDYSTCANIYCNLLSGLSRAAVELLGMSGLVLLLDEAEIARNVIYRYQVQRGLNFFRGLIMTANDDPILLDEDIVPGTPTTGLETGLIYSAHNKTRYTTGIPSYLKVAFALTPGTLQSEFRRYRESIAVIELDILNAEQLRDLFDRILQTFAAVYGTTLSPRGRDRVFHLIMLSGRVSTTRGFIKAVVEAMDFCRFHPRGDLERLITHGLA